MNFRDDCIDRLTRDDILDFVPERCPDEFEGYFFCRGEA
jgi:hypothetical protein